MRLTLTGSNQSESRETTCWSPPPRRSVPAGPHVSSRPLPPIADKWMGFLLDTSGSTGNLMGLETRLSAIAQATLGAIQDLASHSPETVVWVGTFSTRFTCPITPMPVLECLAHLPHHLWNLGPGGSTEFNAALEGACQVFAAREGGVRRPTTRLWKTLGTLLGLQERPRSERLVLLFLSDGHNTGGNPLPAARELRAMGVEIHTVGVGAHRREVGERLLKRIASWDHEHRRPHYRFIGEPMDLCTHFQEVTGRLTLNL